VVASAATVATTGSLQAARRNVEPMLGAVVGSKEATRLRSYLRQLIASPEGRQQLAQLASASPFAAYQQRDEMFCLSYDHVFADAGPSFLAIGDGGRCLPLLWPTPRGGGVRCVHLRYDDEALRVRMEISASNEQPVRFLVRGALAQLAPGRGYDLVYVLRRGSTVSRYELVAIEPID